MNEKFIKQFIEEIKSKYPKISLGCKYDEDEDMFWIYHNYSDLDNNNEIKAYIGTLMKEILFSNGADNFGFEFDYDGNLVQDEIKQAPIDALLASIKISTERLICSNVQSSVIYDRNLIPKRIHMNSYRPELDKGNKFEMKVAS